MAVTIKYRRVYKTTSAVSGSLPTVATLKTNPMPTKSLQEVFRERWAELHNYALSVKQWNPTTAKTWFDAWLETIPAFGCSCRKNWEGVFNTRPADFSSALAFFTWSIDIHNDMNRLLEKPLMSHEEAFVLYGWP